VAAGCGRRGTSCLLPASDLETYVLVVSKVGNLPSKFGHFRPLGFWTIHCVHDGRTDRQTDGQKQCLLPPSLWSGGIKIIRTSLVTARVWLLNYANKFSKQHLVVCCALHTTCYYHCIDRSTFPLMSICLQVFFQIATPATVFLWNFYETWRTWSVWQFVQNCGTDFQNFDFTIFGEFLKSYILT